MLISLQISGVVLKVEQIIFAKPFSVLFVTTTLNQFTTKVGELFTQAFKAESLFILKSGNFLDLSAKFFVISNFSSVSFTQVSSLVSSIQVSSKHSLEFQSFKKQLK